MSAGELRDLVSIQAINPASTDAMGQPVQSWAEVAQVWAGIRHLSGLGVIKAGESLGVIKASIKVRERSDLAAGMRVVVPGGLTYAVQSVLPDAAHRGYMFLVCEAQS